MRDNEFRPANSTVLDAAALEQFIANRTIGAGPGPKRRYNLSVLPGTYLVAGPDQPHGYRRCGAHICLGFVAPLPPNVVLNMTGVTVILTQRDRSAVLVRNGRYFALHGLTTQYQTTPTNQAVVVGIGRDDPMNKSLTVRVEPGYPASDWDRDGKAFPCGVFIPGNSSSSKGWRPGTGMLTYTAIDRTLGSMNHTYTLYYDAGTLPSIGFEQIAVGDLLGCRPRDTAYTFHVQNCSGCKFESISLLGGPGFGFFEDSGGFSSNTFSRCKILPPPKPAGALHAPVLSTAADGLHSSQTRQGPRVQECRFERMGDDGIAIHGTYELVVDAPDRTTLIVSTSGSSDDTRLFKVGDWLRLYDTLLRLAGQIQVASSTLMPSSYLPKGNPTSKTLPKRYHQTGPFLCVKLAHELPVAEGTRVGFDWLLSNANRTGTGFHVQNNAVIDNHARAMNLKASNGIVTNNLLSGNFHGGIVVAPELYWGEADYSRNIEISSNVVSNVGYAKWSYGGIGVGATIPQGQKGNGGGRTFASADGHRNVSITNNTVSDCDTWAIWVSSTTNLQISGNTILRPWRQKTEATYPAPYPVPNGMVVFITEALSVDVYGNCVVDAGPFVISPLNVTSTASRRHIQKDWFCINQDNLTDTP
eukprot:COSAG02_NODE_861_length_16429_cov_75.930680_5_plen_642_part_00